MVCCCAGAVLAVLVFGVLGWAYLKVKKYFEVPPLPRLEETWWGPGEAGAEDSTVEPFRINVSDDVLKDLKLRIENAFPLQEQIQDSGQSYGMNTDLLKTIADFWNTQYDWREREQFLNQYPQFRVSIQGLKIHFLYVKPSNTEGLKVHPLLLVHGWPGSVREFYEIIPLLTTPQPNRDFVFEVVAPSLPGFWFSDATRKKGLGPASMAVIFKNLMKKLGYEQYYVQGGDWGSAVTTDMAILFPQYVTGVLTNMPFSTETPLTTLKIILSSILPSFILTQEEQTHAKFFSTERLKIFSTEEAGYYKLQSTKPDTVGVALRESPVGLLAYIFEKYITWTNPEFLKVTANDVQDKNSLIKILDIITTYWFTRTATSSVRIYYEFFKTDTKLQIGNIPVSEVPSGIARYAYDVFCFPESVLRQKYTKLVYSSFHQRGGHFAALEVPETLAEDIFKFVETVERS